MAEDNTKLWTGHVELSDNKGVLIYKARVEERVRELAAQQLGKPPRLNMRDGTVYCIYNREPDEIDLQALAKSALEIYRERLRQSQARVNRLAKWCEQMESKNKLKIVKH